MRPKVMERNEHNFVGRIRPSTNCMQMYWIYVLKHRKSNEPYYGYTNNLERRLKEHNTEKVWNFIGCERYASELDARERERKLKHYGQARTHLKNRLKRSFESKN